MKTLEYRNRLKNDLEHALCEGNGPWWNELAEKCREAEVEYLLEHVRGTWPVLAKAFDRNNPSE